MHFGVLLYAGFDELDAIAPWEVLSSLARAMPEQHSAALVTLDGRGPVRASHGAVIPAIAERHARGTVVASVCTGALFVAAAGLLDGRPATTHHTALDDLRATGAEVVDGARVVDDGDVLSAGGVTSGLDLVLWLLERFVGPQAAVRAERELEYERRGTVWRRAAP